MISCDIVVTRRHRHHNGLRENRICRGSSHGMANANSQFLPHEIEWVWKKYGSEAVK